MRGRGGPETIIKRIRIPEREAMISKVIED
jgi:hypothetical protein